MSYKNYSQYLKHPTFLHSVSIARKRAGGKCEQCGGKKVLEPHHIKYCKWGEFDPPEHLKMLCRKCHEDAHRCTECGRIKLKARHIKKHQTICDECKKQN